MLHEIPMASQSDLKAEQDILREILHISSSLRQQLGNDLDLPKLDPPFCDPELNIPPFVLPFPHGILAQISTLQIPEGLRESIFHSFHSRILRIQQQYTTSYKRACIESNRLGSSFTQDFKEIRRVYQSLSERHYLPMVKAHVSFILEEVAKYQRRSNSETKRLFNTECIPVLEKYFDYNAYPSAQHQSVLAEKFVMTRRQIEVWFQNHRNRAKKDNKTLRRNTGDLPLRLALSLLQERNPCGMSRSPSPSEEDSATENMEDEDEVPQSTSCIEAFDSFRPQHAFPTTYSSIRSDPFPGDNEIIKLPPSIWMRTPAKFAPACVKSSPINMDEFARMFHVKLNILGGTRKRSSSSRTSALTPWFAVITPSKAPLPALMRTPSLPSSNVLPNSSNLFSYQFPMSSRSTSTASAFLPSPRQDAAKSRKISPLPRRFPTSSDVTALSSSIQSTTRTLSFSSEYSSRSRSSSSSSLDRTPEPTTPPQLPTLDIPAIQDADHVQQRSDEFDFSTFFGEDSNLLTTTSSGNLGHSQSLNLIADKQPPMRLFDFNSVMTFPAYDSIQAQS